MSLHELVKSLDTAEAIQERIATGANVDEIDKLKRTPVHIAAWAGNLEALQILVRANARLDMKAMDGFTALHFAAQSASPGASACIRFLVKKNKALLNMRITKGNKSALHLAAAKGALDNVTALVELGADLIAKTTSGQTASDLAKTLAIKDALSAGPPQKKSKRVEAEHGVAGNDDAVGAAAHAQQADVPTPTGNASANTSASAQKLDEGSPSITSRKRSISEVAEDT